MVFHACRVEDEWVNACDVRPRRVIPFHKLPAATVAHLAQALGLVRRSRPGRKMKTPPLPPSALPPPPPLQRIPRAPSPPPLVDLVESPEPMEPVGLSSLAPFTREAEIQAGPSSGMELVSSNPVGKVRLTIKVVFFYFLFFLEAVVTVPNNGLYLRFSTLLTKFSQHQNLL